MDLGIAGRRAIVCASSRGLGKACAKALAEAGCDVVINGRTAPALAEAEREIQQTAKGQVISVLADVGTEQGRAALLKACSDPDILVNNNAGPPPRDFRKLSHEDLLAGVEANMMTPILLIQAVVDGMVQRKFGRIINITSGSVKMPLPLLDLSSGARAGLTGFLAGVARQVAASNVTINHILPGAFATDRLHSIMEKASKDRQVSFDQIAEDRRQTIPARRFGEPDELGKLCAFIASAHAGFITGQNLLIDGGSFPSAF
jgi:3-oxoacyl-[acyl-carrier protein] reductase